jgi:hypothetical protein
MPTKFDENSVIQPNRTHKWPDIMLIAILSLLPLLFFWRLITPNLADRMHIVAGDFTEQYFPLRAFAAQQWVQGELPLWNPYLYGGQPALADIQSGALYPPHVIESLLLGWGGPILGYEIGFPVWALELQVIFHFSLAAVGMYLFVRHLARQSSASWRQARFAGVIGSVAFTYGGYLTGFPVQQMTILSVSAWLPWVMWAVSVTHHRVGQKLKQWPATWVDLLAPIAWGGLAWAMAILAGHPQTVLYIFYLAFVFTIFRTFVSWHTLNSDKNSIGKRIILLVRIFGVYTVCWLTIVLLGVLVASAQLLPTLEFIQRSLRADLSYQAVSAGLPLNELISIIYPGYFGGSPEYVGIVTMVLIVFALVLGRPRSDIFFWAGTGLVSLLLAFGGNTFLYPLAYLLAPGFEAVRQQERAFLVYSFSAAVLAGYGAIALMGPLSRITRRKYVQLEKNIRVVTLVFFILTGTYIFGSAMSTARGDDVNLFVGVLRHHLFGLLFLGGMVVLLALRGQRLFWRRWGMVLLVIWLAFNLFTVNWRFNLEKREIEPFVSGGVVEFLQYNLPSDGQTLAQGRIVSGGFLPGGNSAAAVYNLQDLTGNTPLQLAQVDNFFRQMPAWRMWQLLNVRYIVDNRDISSKGLSLVFAEDDLNIFEMGDPFPRAWFVSEVEVIPENDQALLRLASDTFDLRQTAVVADPLAEDLSDAGASTITITELSPTYLKANVDASSSHLLVFSQIFYPGWQVKIDDRPAELMQVNAVLQGVVVPVGQHGVELSFEPNSFWWGSAISFGGIIIAVALMLFAQIKKPH